LNRTLKDIKENDSIMGGTTVLLAGDFRQTLPIVPSLLENFVPMDERHQTRSFKKYESSS
jgi:hypothetical protein